MLRAGHRDRRGLTLLELVLVLGILAVLTTVAVESLAPLAERSRYEATRRTLVGLRSATLGDFQATPRWEVSGGFVADTGRLPDSLAELVGPRPGDLPPFQLVRVGGVNGGAFVPIGWRGSYLARGLDAFPVVDGWGNPLEFDPPDSGTPPGYRSVVSLAGSSGSSADPSLQLQIAPEDWLAGTLLVSLDDVGEPAGGGGGGTTREIHVWVLGPAAMAARPGDLLVGESSTGQRLVRARHASVMLEPSGAATVSFDAEDALPVGPRVVWASSDAQLMRPVAEPVYATLRARATHRVSLSVNLTASLP